MSLLELRHVSKAYNEKVLALDDVNLTVEKGEWLAVMGPSGSGKSTLMNIIGCMDSATSGEVILDGDVLTDASPEELTRYRRDKIGMVFQQFNLFSHLSVLDNLTLAPRRVRKLSREEARDRAMALLTRVGLEDHAHKYPHALSGGQQQRVAIA
ncbi:ABC transporter ATP-binding protein, partial [Selenomonas noxia]|uniref:ABC transporter ATP-binding protein n=1 Tax=Selenomonas noxia TaxID=135083 RepID=UPI0023F0F603